MGAGAGAGPVAAAGVRVAAGKAIPQASAAERDLPVSRGHVAARPAAARAAGPSNRLYQQDAVVDQSALHASGVFQSGGGRRCTPGYGGRPAVPAGPAQRACFFLKLTLIRMLMTAMPAKKTMSASMRWHTLPTRKRM